MHITAAAAASGFMCFFYYSAGGCRWWETCPAHPPPVPLLALLHSRAVSLLGTFPRPWRAQPCFHTLQHGGTRDPACRAPFSDASRRPPMRALIGGEEAVPPPGIQRRLTREPHVTEVGQRCAESEGLFNSTLCSPHFPNAPPKGFVVLLRRDHGVEVAGTSLEPKITLRRSGTTVHIWN